MTADTNPHPQPQQPESQYEAWRCMHLSCGIRNRDTDSHCWSCGMPYGSVDPEIERLIAAREQVARLDTIDRIEAERSPELKEFNGVKLAVVTISALNNERRRIKRLAPQRKDSEGGL